MAANMSNNVTQKLMKTAFGELSVAEATPVVQLSAQYGLTDEVMEIVSDGGTTYNGSSLFNVSTGVGAAGLASLNSNKQLAYKAGQGALARFTSLFTAGVPDSLQAAGLINSEDAFAFGYVGETFGIIYSRYGVTEHQELTVISPGTGNITLTIRSVPYIVLLTAGDTNHNAQEIALSLSGQVDNFLFSANENVVSSMDLLPESGGNYISSRPSVATWSQKQAGQEPTITPIPQTEWNRDTASWLDPTKGNVYSVSVQYLGFGNVQFYVEDEITGLPLLVHQLEYANKNILPSVGNPTFRIGWLARNLGNTTDLVVSGASAAGFIEGKNVIDTLPRAAESVASGIGATQENVLTIRNRFHFGDKINRADIIPLLLSLSTDSTKGTFFRLTINPTFGGDLNFTYIDEANSVAEVATDQTAVSGGRFLASFVVTTTGLLLSSSDFKSRILPDDYLTISAGTTSGGSDDVVVSAVWQEDT